MFEGKKYCGKMQATHYSIQKVSEGKTKRSYTLVKNLRSQNEERQKILKVILDFVGDRDKRIKTLMNSLLEFDNRF